MGGFLLSSCKLSVPLEIQQSPDGKVSIEGIEHFGKPCIESLQIADSYALDASVYWSVIIKPIDGPARPCFSKLTYPDTPVDFDLSSPARELVTGRTYYVSASGPGFDSSVEFVRRKVK
ncbi:hypothetical protein GCM10009087_02700 [Sphingomonas oligophenolica]